MPRGHFPTAVAAIVILVLSCLVRAADSPEQNDEVVNLVHQLTDAVRDQDTAAASNLLDMDALFDRVTAGVDAPAGFRAAVKDGFGTSVVMGPIVKAAKGGTYHFLQVRQVNGETHVLFRMIPQEGGVNYHDWVVGKDDQGDLKLQDAYIAVSGETLAQTMHRTYVQGALAANPGFLDRLTGKDKEFAANRTKFQELGQYALKAQYKELLDAYKALPKSMQEDKTCMVMRLLAAGKLNEELPQEYKDAMADYKRLFPGDPSVDLVCLDALLQTRQFIEARQSLDHIDAFAGGDPYLLVLRGTTYKLEGGDDNFRAAKQWYQKAADAEPTLADAYWALVALSLETRQYDETAAELTQIEQKLHLKISDLTKVPLYAGFVKSDAYKKWMASQTPRKPTTAAP